MRRPVRAPLVVGLSLALVAVVALGAALGARWWSDRGSSRLAQAAAYAPADAERLSFTDWAAVRAATGADLDARSSATAVRAFLDDAFDDDLTSTSALVGSAPVLHRTLGFSPATAEWELFSQSAAGAVVVVRLADAAAVDTVAEHLAAAGFTEPADDGGVWRGGETLLPKLGPELTPELQYAALDRDERLVLTSDRADYLAEVVDDLGDGEGDGGLPEELEAVVAASGEPLSAAVYDGAHTCGALAMSQADPADQAAAERLLAEAGEVDPVRGFAMSVQPGGGVRVVMAFADSDQARANADSRAALASGPAPGQGGEFTDRFTLDTASAEGDLVTLDLQPRPGVYAFSDLATGPVLFATC